jgi:hypothetical protein
MMNGGFISVISTLRRAGLICDRDNTIEAMQKLSERLPEDALYSLPPLVVFAPSAANLEK